MSLSAFVSIPNFWKPLNLTQWVSQSQLSESLDSTPLPVVIVGLPESAQLVRLAIEAGAVNRDSARPLYVAAVFTDDTLNISDPDRPGAGLVKSFIENALAIANRMPQPNPSSQELRESTQWLMEFASFCGIEHAIWAAPEPLDEELALLLREASQIFRHVWPASQLSNKEVSS